VGAVAGIGAAFGALALWTGVLGAPRFLPAYLAGITLAAASSLVGFALLRRAVVTGSRGFVGLLMGVFLGRVLLVGLFGLVLLAAAPAQLAVGLFSLVGFHFLFAVVEVSLLARSGAFKGVTRRQPS
jgi:hypothetical protein